ncbi:tryptophan--tRNA ligase [Candidatus Marsarchaeota G1 archaeon BE_D]|jgi:tryptophanyl-tRNA synthetase|uniref:Tryptophan--tRNA ligase n=2 Tax=Candidatus Marsarchaeota TaxID=1978152 RepID=A0A2R6AIE3_9ARCH|nr:MAG: tryptophan--tRNA ligase [Candidatus Marsarchaeota G1 archaeon BE_D]
MKECKLSETIIDPWGSSDIADYSRLFELFGIEPVSKILDKFPVTHRLLRRGMWFGHRDLTKVLDAVSNGSEYAVMSGIKPTGVFHLGTKTTAEAMVYFQSLSNKSRVFYAVADVEAYCDNGIKFSQSHELAVSNVADILAIGLKPERVYVYKQSEEKRVMNLASVFSKAVTTNMMHAIYGERPFGLYFSALVQAGDILLPQLKVFGGPKPVVVPVGVDQDPHIRLTRDLAKRYSDEFGFIEPSAVFHKLVRSLQGTQKMSKRDPMSVLTLNEDPAVARKKIMNALTGGRATAEEQRRLGGEPDKCVVYEYYRDHFLESDAELEVVRVECVSGKRLCGECKAQLAELVEKYMTEHTRKKEKCMDLARKLLEEGSEIARSGGEIF